MRAVARDPVKRTLNVRCAKSACGMSAAIATRSMSMASSATSSSSSAVPDFPPTNHDRMSNSNFQDSGSDGKSDSFSSTRQHGIQFQSPSYTNDASSRVAVVGNMRQILSLLPSLWQREHIVVPVDSSINAGMSKLDQINLDARNDKSRMKAANKRYSDNLKRHDLTSDPYNFYYDDLSHRLSLSQVSFAIGDSEKAQEIVREMGVAYDGIENYRAEDFALMQGEEEALSCFSAANGESAQQSSTRVPDIWRRRKRLNYLSHENSLDENTLSMARRMRYVLDYLPDDQILMHMYGAGVTRPSIITAGCLRSRVKISQGMWNFSSRDCIQTVGTEALVDGGIAPLIHGANIVPPEDRESLVTGIFATNWLARFRHHRSEARFIALNVWERPIPRFEDRHKKVDPDFAVKYFFTPETGIIAKGSPRYVEKHCNKGLRMKNSAVKDSENEKGSEKDSNTEKTAVVTSTYAEEAKQLLITGPNVASQYYGFQHTVKNKLWRDPLTKLASYNIKLSESLQYTFGRWRKRSVPVKDKPDWGIKKVAMVYYRLKRAAGKKYTYLTKKHTNAKRIIYKSRYK